MNYSPRQILLAIAIVLIVVSFFAPIPWQVPTLLIAIAGMLP